MNEFGYVIVEKYIPIIFLNDGSPIYLEEQETYRQAYKAIEEYIEDIDEKLFYAGESMFEFQHASIEKRFVREWKD
jgi:Ribonuclease G/E